MLRLVDIGWQRRCFQQLRGWLSTIEFEDKYRAPM